MLLSEFGIAFESRKNGLTKANTKNGNQQTIKALIMMPRVVEALRSLASWKRNFLVFDDVGLVLCTWNIESIQNFWNKGNISGPGKQNDSNLRVHLVIRRFWLFFEVALFHFGNSITAHPWNEMGIIWGHKITFYNFYTEYTLKYNLIKIS